MAVNNNKNTQNNNQNVKVVVNVEAPKRGKRKAPKRPQQPPPPPVQNVIVQPLNTTLIPGFNTPDYFNTALTNQQMTIVSLANALERKYNNDYEKAAVSAGNVMGGVMSQGTPSKASSDAAISGEEAAVNNPTVVEEPVVFAQPPPQQQPEPEPQHQQQEQPNMNNNPLFEEGVNPVEVPLPDDDPIYDNPRVRPREDNYHPQERAKFDDLVRDYRASHPRSDERANLINQIRELAARLRINARDGNGRLRTVGVLNAEIRRFFRNNMNA